MRKKHLLQTHLHLLQVTHAVRRQYKKRLNVKQKERNEEWKGS